MRTMLSALALSLAAPLIAAEPAAAPPARFVQKDFCISFWVAPPIDDQADEHYRDIAEAHFNVVMGNFGANTPAHAARMLELCEKYGLKALIPAGIYPSLDQLPDSPACIGYLVKDEPNVADFPALAEKVKALREARPGRLAYINLYPSHASKKQFGVDTYDEHVSRFMSEVGVDVLSFDRYPVMRPDADERDGYCENLDVIRRHALEAGVPFWNFFNIIPYGRHFDPTEAQVDWQIYTSIAYGAKGVLYFCYWTPRGREFPKGGAIIAADGRKTRHYDQARRINAKIKPSARRS